MRFLRVLQRGGGCAHRLGPPARRPPEAVAVAVAAVLLTAAMLVTPISTMIPVASAQLAGPVGPLTPLSRKSTICNVVDYEAAATGESFDIGPAILSAFENCVKPNGGATLYVPPGDYNMSTWVTLNNGANWAFQMDGTITRTGTAGGHMIIVNGGSDFEMFSSTQAGAFQGAGVDFHKQGLHVYGPRILRLVRVVDFSLHDLIFVDSPSFHVFLDNVSNGMIYNLMIRGHDEGGLDGIDISGDNNHVKNIEVTNRDECVCVKSPASNMLIEDILCNQSGGMSMGSYNQSTAVSNIHMRNIVSYYSTHFLMIKTYPNGNGYVRDSTFENFSGFTSAYGLLVNQYWQNTPFDQDVSGVALSNLTFSNWTGVSSDANQRPPTFFACSAPTPCVDVTVTAVSFWDPAHAMTAEKCQSAYGVGACLVAAGNGSAAYPAVTNTLRNPPVEWTQPGVPAGALDAGFNLSTPIAIPAMPFPPIDPAALDTDTDDAPSPASSSSSSPPSSADTMASTAGAGAGAGQAQAQGARAGPAQASSAACGRRPRRGMLACNAFAAVGFAMMWAVVV